MFDLNSTLAWYYDSIVMRIEILVHILASRKRSGIGDIDAELIYGSKAHVKG